ncbi:hypothetical protein M407DRAFT_21235 [Tulasnella calospora MUT 4182]|uniref:Cytochrome P450 n=1 Tax=Tulasnella calospora MUT 4182 TaxID=1051891 RepID=A0A0C3L706_9AGAM|nr:hypothetical protein M407DRAFT_21235 [Tulasnella calospora MUT 4182]
MASHLPDTLASNGLAITGAALALLLLGRYWTSVKRLPYPPGPRPLPLLGNLLDVPNSRFALTWTKLAEKYGPLTFLTVPGQHVLIISSVEAAKDLLEKRGSIYMDRPRFVMVGELVGLEYLTTLSRSSPTWKKHRSLLKHTLSAQVVKRDYSAHMTKKAEQYLHYLSTRPEEFLKDLNKVMAENILELTYGRRDDEEGRDYVKLNSYVMETSIRAIEGYIVDFVPALRHLPSWLPGMQFKRDAAKWKQEIEEVRRATFERAKRSVVSGDAEHVSAYMLNNLRDLYHKHEESGDTEALEEGEMAINATGFSFFIAGVDTTQFTAHGILLAMILFPSVQEKAQAEIDRVVGRDRLPTFNDQQDLPYLHAVVLEALRWGPSVPSGLARRSLSDDVYNGYLIPEGTTIIFNTWGMSRNTQYYKNPSTFDPERHLKPNPELDPREFVFGFGRRICPGNELAFQTLWIMAASILWAFKLKRVEGDPTPLDDDVDRFNFDFLSSPVPFKCQIIPRADDLKDKFSHSF